MGGIAIWRPTFSCGTVGTAFWWPKDDTSWSSLIFHLLSCCERARARIEQIWGKSVDLSRLILACIVFKCTFTCFQWKHVCITHTHFLASSAEQSQVHWKCVCVCGSLKYLLRNGATFHWNTGIAFRMSRKCAWKICCLTAADLVSVWLSLPRLPFCVPSQLLCPLWLFLLIKA